MRQKRVRSLLQASLIVFASHVPIAAAAPIHPTIPPLMASSGLQHQIAQIKIPYLNGYRGYSSARSGYIKSANGYWYPARAFDDYCTGSVGRPQRLNDRCDHGFAPTNGSSNCNY
ncbi:cell surface protein [Rhizobium hidalgonense]|uniref:Cell surface protein n=1 Tax=Rhizobium hidalgonense TaxID=1538159 RepID=A0ABX4JWN5_9HYPH|nr:cell surface protein [Rhizobium hidalgonense]PDT24523.1 cell surface protein [Rhizobium hidalgonense]PON04912.1 cell surface protein [Rhizobium hidalgonense]